MALGPVDVVIIGFPGNKFSAGSRRPSSTRWKAAPCASSTCCSSRRTPTASRPTIEIEDLDPDGPAFVEVTSSAPGALGPEDAEEVAEDLPPNSSALLIAFENTWAAEFAVAFARGRRRRSSTRSASPPTSSRRLVEG